MLTIRRRNQSPGNALCSSMTPSFSPQERSPGPCTWVQTGRTRAPANLTERPPPSLLASPRLTLAATPQSKREPVHPSPLRTPAERLLVRERCADSGERGAETVEAFCSQTLGKKTGTHLLEGFAGLLDAPSSTMLVCLPWRWRALAAAANRDTPINARSPPFCFIIILHTQTPHGGD